ncbi:Fic family protein [Micrococcus luteus]
MSVLLLGRGSDPVLAYLQARARALGTPCGFVDAVRVAAEGSWDLELPAGRGRLRCGGEAWDLSACTTIVARSLDPCTAQGPTPERWAGFMDSVGPWLRACPLAVANPPPPRGSAPAPALARLALADVALPAADWRWPRGAEPGQRASGPRDDGAAAGVYVVGDAVFPSPARPAAGRLPGADVQRALAEATAALGWLLARWDASVDRDGVWRWLGAEPAPDFRLDDRLLDGALSRRILALRPRPPERNAPGWAASGPGATGPAPTLDRGECRTGLEPCPCGSPSWIPALDRLLAEAGAHLDRGLRVPERWRGAMRRESLRYGTPEERASYEEAFNRVAHDASLGAFPPLTVDRLRDLHVGAGGDGELRTVHLWIPGGHTFPHPAAVLPLLQELCAAYEESSGAGAVIRAGYSAVLRLHLGLLTIHPFRDGNGRLSRLVAARELMRRGYRGRPLTILDQHYERWPHVYTALLVAVEEGRICRPACILGMQLAALAGAWRAAPSLARVQWRAVEPCLRGLTPGDPAAILGPVLEDLSAAAGER